MSCGPSKTSDPIKRRIRKPPVPKRRLRVYALDPSVGKKLASIDVNETTLSVPWEEDLQPGPIYGRARELYWDFAHRG